MAVVNTKATAVSNADASPTQSFSSTKVIGGRVKEEVGVVAVANGDSIGSTLRFGRVHSSWRVSQLLLASSAITGAAADIGLYDVDKAGGAVVDVDFFASAASLAAVQNGVDVTHEAGGSGASLGNIANMEKPLWQVLGLTTDPGKFYDVVATLTAAATADGTAALQIRYLDGN
jgi:hypothetical protein